MDQIVNSISDIKFLLKKFNETADYYLTADKVINNHIELKREHTFRVCKEITDLSQKLGLDPEKSEIAYLTALFHDIGRFEQFHRFKTFNDDISIDHALLAIDTIKKNNFLDYIPSNWHERIVFSILNHNKPSITKSDDSDKIIFARLIRDADKLDIWKVIADNELRRIIEYSPETNQYHVPDDIFGCFEKKTFVRLSMAKSLNDMRLLRISWVFDINFLPSFDEIKKRKILVEIFKLIPESERLEEMKHIVLSFITDKTNT